MHEQLVKFGRVVSEIYIRVYITGALPLTPLGDFSLPDPLLSRYTP